MPIKISVVDDHPAIATSYKIAIQGLSLAKFAITIRYSIKECYNAIFSDNDVPELLLIDLSMPPYIEKNITDGFELAQLIRQQFPKTKIIILTMHSSPLYIYSIIEKLKPEGFLIKSDVDLKEISDALKSIISEGFYNSKTVKEIVTNVKKHAFCDDDLNRNIIILTSKRHTNKEIAQALKISESTVEKKKAQLKQHLGIERSNDKKMIEMLTNLKLL